MRTPMFVLFSALSFQVGAADVLEEIKITAHPLAADGVAQSTKVIAGDELAEKMQGSLGETVAGEVGIRSASFGVAVGRPVIHGLGGPRIKTTEDRIDSLDVSVTSTDHAVTVEPFIANQINILKGPSTLLYGSGAIGGVVDVETGRIARELPESTTGRIEFRGVDNGDGTALAGRLDGAANQLAWHLDFFDRDADDFEIPGFVESAAQRELEELEEAAEHGDEEGHDHEEGEEERDILEGSFSESRGGAVGFSFIGDSGFAGISVGTIDSTYGLVGGHGHEEEEEGEEHDEEEHEEEGEEAPGRIELEQTRIDVEGQLNFDGGFFKTLNLRAGVNDYEHQEIEGNGEIGTLFDNDAWEARVEAAHNPLAGFEGVFGLQFSDREFSAVGEEAFVPQVDSDSIGVFWVGQREFGDYDLELGARLEEVSHAPSANPGQELDFTSFSASAGLVWSASEAWTFAGLIDVSNRAPSIEELFSDGPHLATQSFEVGDVGLTEESATSLTLSADYRSELFDLSASVYTVEFDDFIYQLETGLEEDGLPVLFYVQDDASFTGLDLELAWHLGELAGGDFDVILQFDTVDAKLDVGANRNLPRIPSDRARAQAVWNNDAWTIKFGVGRTGSQRNTAAFELPTEGYDDISLHVSRTFELASGPLTLFFNGRNLSDEEQRHHASFVKDFAPAPGRRLELGARFSF